MRCMRLFEMSFEFNPPCNVGEILVFMHSLQHAAALFERRLVKAPFVQPRLNRWQKLLQADVETAAFLDLVSALLDHVLQEVIKDQGGLSRRMLKVLGWVSDAIDHHELDAFQKLAASL